MQPENQTSTPQYPDDLRIYSPSQQWPDDYALDRAKEDFELAESYRSTNHDWRFRNADELYLGWAQQKMWEGTRIPRSSLGIYLVFEQVESMLPKVVSSIFSNPEWFDAEPMPTTTYQQARAVSDVMRYHLTAPESNPALSAREVFRRVAKDALIYCNGVAEIGWKSESIKRRKLFREFVPRRATLDLSQMLGAGTSIQVPTGQFTSRVRDMEFTDKIDRPFVRHISLKDFYIDPNCPSPVVQEGQYCFVRKFMPLGELSALRDTYKFQIPDDNVLRMLTTQKPDAQADWTKGAIETVRTGQWNPQIDQTSDPAGKRVEVIARWDKDRLIWIADRKVVLLNVPNPYGFIPFYSVSCYDVPDRFYGQSISDVNEGEQRLQQSIINGRCDELSLSLHAPMIKKRGTTIPAYQLRTRPGQVIEADNPETDIIWKQSQNITQQAFVEIQYSEQRAQKYTGITDIAMIGGPSAGGNSASRTATGINTQVAASSSRVAYFVENFEDTFAEPLLRGILNLEKRFLDPNTPIQILGEDGKDFLHDPLDVINADVRFKIRASTRMRSRQMLLQTFPHAGADHSES